MILIELSDIIELSVITSITLKKYLSVNGDGKSTILNLIKNDDRAILYLDLISEINKDKLQTIPKNNEEVVLNIIGNHSKGTQFIDGNHLISTVLTKLFDVIGQDIEGWNYPLDVLMLLASVFQGTSFLC